MSAGGRVAGGHQFPTDLTDSVELLSGGSSVLAGVTVWEYMTISAGAHPNDIFTAMQRAGRDGWELVGPIGYSIYLKRPVQGWRG